MLQAGGRAAARSDAGVPPILAPLRRWLGGSTQNLALAGAELGLWNFLASSFQALGLEITSATRASFLIQARAFGFSPFKHIVFLCFKGNNKIFRMVLTKPASSHPHI